MNTADNASMTMSCAADIGLALQQHREKKHISLEDAARELRLSVRQVAALENGQFSGFRSAVFVKGYFRACAKLYGMDGDALIRVYERVWIHAGDVVGGFCSHGCINVPINSAEKLFYWADLKTPVLILDSLDRLEAELKKIAGTGASG